MAIYRLQCSFGADTAFPRDRITITPHFKVTISPNPQALCDDLAAALSTYTAANREVVVKAYDAELVPRSGPPVGQKTLNAGLTPASPGIREVALCLSYYADNNVPRRRGRLYIPAMFLATGTLPVRPTQAHRDSLGQFVTMFKNLGGVDTDWVVWSRADHQAHTITNWFADDEWDSQRRRGLRPTTRSVGTLTG